MIMEVRTYTLQPGATPTVMDLFAAAVPARTKVSPIAGFFRSEVGALNQIMMLWPYADLTERERIRAIKVDGWPPPIRKYGVELDVKILHAAPFSPKPAPQKYGNLYEIRQYTYAPGSISKVIDAWGKQLDARVKFSPLVFAGQTEIGLNNVFTHIWAYKDAADREHVRGEVRKAGVWPPKMEADVVTLREQNALVIPAPFSPWQ